MKRATLAVLVTLVPLAAAAQDPAAPQPATTEAAAVTATADAASQAAVTRDAKRRPSMVGYIEDATLRSQFRVRFDAGRDIDSPDRAEFFYGKCGCYRSLPASSPAYDPNAPGPGPGNVTGLNFQQLHLYGEYASHRASFFAEIPVRWISPIGFAPNTGSFGNQSGLADLAIGGKVSLASSDEHDVTVMVRGSFPTGDAAKGLGTDHGTVEPALLVRQTLGGRAQIEGMFGDVHPTGGSAGPLPGNGRFSGDVLYYGIGPSMELAHTDNVRVAPVVELVGWHVLSGYQTSTFVTGGTGDASGLNIVNLKIGARTMIANGGSFYVGYGFALTSNTWYDKILRFEYRTTF